jgi:hypothetical protein
VPPWWLTRAVLAVRDRNRGMRRTLDKIRAENYALKLKISREVPPAALVCVCVCDQAMLTGARGRRSGHACWWRRRC